MTDKEVTDAYATAFDKERLQEQWDAFRAPFASCTTKDSGERIAYPSGMTRDVSDGKPRFDLLFPEDIPYDDQLLTRWAELMGRGAEKYSSRNWEAADSVEEWERFKESALRHLIQWVNGEDDEDHAAAVLFNIMGAELVAWKHNW